MTEIPADRFTCRFGETEERASPEPAGRVVSR